MAEGRVSAKLEQLTQTEDRVCALQGEISAAEGRLCVRLEQCSKNETQMSAVVERALMAKVRLEECLIRSFEGGEPVEAALSSVGGGFV